MQSLHLEAAAGGMDPHLEKSLQARTPKDALARLMEGNARFAQVWAAGGAGRRC